MGPPPEPGDPRIDDLAAIDEILQVMYWLGGERLAQDVPRVDAGALGDAAPLRREADDPDAAVLGGTGALDEAGRLHAVDDAGDGGVVGADLAGQGAEREVADLVQAGVLGPLNAKLGQSCFGLGATTPDRVTVTFDKRCADASVLQRFETYPPAGLYGAPPARQKSVIKNPETLRKLTT